MLLKPFRASLSSLTVSTQFGLLKHFCSKMEVNIISKETIEPSSPTPDHLRTFKLSLLDQIASPTYAPFVFFYPTNDRQPKIEERLATLKDSLSKTLACFYPVAGRIKDRSSIDCNDKGASYTEAQVSCHMSEFLRQPKIELLNQFLPCQPICKEPQELAAQVVVKANIFACGGIAIGLCFFHRIMDGYTVCAFLKEWAAIARGCGSRDGYAHNKATSLFPPDELVFSRLLSRKGNLLVKEGKSCTRRFVFDAAAISTLKAKARSDQVCNPTRSEVISGLIWKSAMNASTAISGCKKPSEMVNAVNIRPRMKSPLPDYSVGNLTWKARAFYSATAEEGVELHHLVSLLRSSIGKVNGEYVQNLQGEEGYREICKELEELEEMYSRLGKPVCYGITSVVRMGFYEMDFGWGKPVWVSLGGAYETLFKNVFLLMDSTSGDGVEAWVVLDELEMAIFERDPEILEYSSLNPSIKF